MSKFRLIVFAIVLSAVVVGIQGIALGFPGQEKIIYSETGRKGGLTTGSGRWVVGLKEEIITKSLVPQGSKDAKAVLEATVNQLQESVISKLKATKGFGSGFEEGARFKNTPIFTATMDEASLQTLASMAEVEALVEDMELEEHTAQGLPMINPGIYRQPSNGGGAGIAIAIIDSGVNYLHPALGGGPIPNGKVIGGYDLALGSRDPMDKNGHGTACASIAAGLNTGKGDYIGGVAPEAKIYALKTEDAKGKIWYSAMMLSMDWCLTHQFDDPANPIKIISMSLGRPKQHFNQDCPDCDKGMMKRLATKAMNQGIAVFVSAGNEAKTDGISFTSCVSPIMPVGALYDGPIGQHKYSVCTDASPQQNQVACYSNSAKILALLAPSNDASVAYIPGSKYRNNFGGTSAACPYTAGAAALIQSAYKVKTGRYLTVEDLKKYMIQTGDPVTDPKSGVTTPRVNIAKAVEAAVAGPPSAGQPDGSLADPGRKIEIDKLKDLLKPKK